VKEAGCSLSAGSGPAELDQTVEHGFRLLGCLDLEPNGAGEGHEVDLTALAAASPFGVVRLAAWRWPGPVRFAERLELVRAPATESPAT
jgi:hypothetical protein